MVASGLHQNVNFVYMLRSRQMFISMAKLVFYHQQTLHILILGVSFGRNEGIDLGERNAKAESIITRVFSIYGLTSRSNRH